VEHVIDSESCAECGHDHLPLSRPGCWYATRQDECVEPGCDCEDYEPPEREEPRVYKCSSCARMVTRVWRRLAAGQYCDDCHDEEHQ